MSAWNPAGWQPWRLGGATALAVCLVASSPNAESAARAWTATTGDVRVSCQMTVGGSFEARTSAIAGHLSVDPSTSVLAGELDVDLKTLDTGIALRTQHMQETYLEVGKGEGFEKATLSSIDVGSLASGVEGQKPFTAHLRLHGVTKTVTGRATLSSRGSSVRVDASFPVRISEYGVAAPRYLGVGVKDDVSVRVVFNATPTF
jgi:polyisoprenoid-binding protein YceI